MRLMSIRRVGRASRITIIGTSVWPPAMTRAPSSAASHVQASSISAARQYSNGAAFISNATLDLDYGNVLLCLAAAPAPRGAKRAERRGDIVRPSPVWLKSLSHYRNCKNHGFAHHDCRQAQSLHPQYRGSAV